jgi:hypothetical protein
LRRSAQSVNKRNKNEKCQRTNRRFQIEIKRRNRLDTSLTTISHFFQVSFSSTTISHLSQISIARYRCLLISFFIMIDRIIKYLNSITRFDISNVNISLTYITFSSVKFVKSNFNVEIVKIYCDISKNNFATHIRKEKKVSLTKRSCFLRLNDRTFVRTRRLYIFMNVYEVLIEKKSIWFISFMSTSQKRYVTALNVKTKHTTWKIKAHSRYVTVRDSLIGG